MAIETQTGETVGPTYFVTEAHRYPHATGERWWRFVYEQHSYHAVKLDSMTQ